MLGPSLELFHGDAWTLRGRELLARLERLLTQSAAALGEPQLVPAPATPDYGIASGGHCLEVRVAESERTRAQEAFARLAQALELTPHRIPRPWGDELHLIDGLGRSWPVGHIDSRPRTGASSGHADPIRKLRVQLSCPARRLIALLLEQGRPLPLGLAPEQVRVLPVSDEQRPYAAAVVGRLRRAGLRAEAQPASSPLAGRFRQAVLSKIPRIAVVGPREVRERTVSIGDSSHSLEAFVRDTVAAAQAIWKDAARTATVAARGERTQDRMEDSHRIP